MPYHGILLCVVAALLGASAVGMVLHGRLGERQKSRETVDHVRLVISILVTFTALVLGLLLSDVKTSYNAFENRLRALDGSITELDQRLRQYGEETAPIRANLRAYLAGAIADTWRDEPRPYGVYPVYPDPAEGVERTPLGNLLIEVDSAVRRLEPTDPFHAGLANLLQTQSTELLQQRRLAIETVHDTISWPLLVAMTMWLAIVFGVFGLTAPRNAVVYATIALCALSFASAIFFILDFDRPLTGLIRVSSEPALEALRHLDTP
ncbi:MAG TPA: hypothetical protein VJY34_07530 [Roseiarcus sp.]|nr:hypothetical protein [Roseiarcus sp.]